jgi:hypothetical protein
VNRTQLRHAHLTTLQRTWFGLFLFCFYFLFLFLYFLPAPIMGKDHLLATQRGLCDAAVATTTTATATYATTADATTTSTTRERRANS